MLRVLNWLMQEERENSAKGSTDCWLSYMQIGENHDQLLYSAKHVWD